MLEFKPLGKDVNVIKDYIEKSESRFCDLSLGVKYMWRDDFIINYAFCGDSLIMEESCADYDGAFYYPLGGDVNAALRALEEYCQKKHEILRFCCIDNDMAVTLIKRYNDVEIYNLRDWSDYIYDAESFKTFAGGKYGGQRNHLNKFKKSYPDYVFREITAADFSKIKEFLAEYERGSSLFMWTAKEEESKTFDLIENMFSLNQKGGLIEVDGKIIAVSVGEIVGDTLIAHIEKGLKSYEGVYQAMCSEFAKAFAAENVKYINREEDCGDNGLRISKLQYHPLEVKQKNIVVVKTLFDKVPNNINIVTQRLVVRDLEEKDKSAYAELYLDDQLNKYWGYDYREDLNGFSPDENYFFAFAKRLKGLKEEYSLAVTLDGKLIGELVMHNFDYTGGVEIGFRFFAEYQGKGYASESASALIDFLVKTVKPVRVKSRCNKKNDPSHRLILRLGLTEISSDKEYLYFEKQF